MRSIAWILSATVVAMGAGTAAAQNFPVKPIRIFTGSVGGNNDATSRFIAQGISGPLGQPVIVEPRPVGASPEIVAKSAPDGYSVLLVGDLVWLAPLLRGQSDPMADFAPISMLGNSPNVLVVHPSLPVKSVKEFIALAKSRAGDLNYATAGVGGIDHLGGELFKSMTSTRIVGVPFKTTTSVLTALISGEVQVWFGGASLVTTHMKSGRVKALAVTSEQPSILTPGVPTLAASGLPGFDLVNTDAMYAPAKTPAAVIRRLNDEVVRFLRTPAATEQYLARGSEVVATTPEEHATRLKHRITIIGKVIRDAGIKAD
jgi:tripartite-type tricarboxylate transporter receptor subunit TctC